MRVPAAERLLAAIGYVPLLPSWLLPVMFKRDSMFCQFHGRQAGVLWGLWFAPVAILMLVAVFVAALTQQYALYYFGFLALYTIVYLFLSGIVGIYKALMRERYRMPVVADVALLLRL